MIRCNDVIAERYRDLMRQRQRLLRNVTPDESAVMHLICGIKEGYPLCCVIQFAQDALIGLDYIAKMRWAGSKKNEQGSVIYAIRGDFVPCWSCVEEPPSDVPNLAVKKEVEVHV